MDDGHVWRVVPLYEFEVLQPLESKVVTMLGVALRGIGNYWNDIVIPGFDFLVVENTLGKFGSRVETLTKLPNNVQGFVRLRK